MKKIEIIERITDANGSISENILTSWEHKNQFIPEIIRFGELKIYLQEQYLEKKWFMIWYGMNLIPVIIMWLCDISAISEKK